MLAKGYVSDISKSKFSNNWIDFTNKIVTNELTVKPPGLRQTSNLKITNYCLGAHEFMTSYYFY